MWVVSNHLTTDANTALTAGLERVLNTDPLRKLFEMNDTDIYRQPMMLEVSLALKMKSDNDERDSLIGGDKDGTRHIPLCPPRPQRGTQPTNQLTTPHPAVPSTALFLPVSILSPWMTSCNTSSHRTLSIRRHIPRKATDTQLSCSYDCLVSYT